MNKKKFKKFKKGEKITIKVKPKACRLDAPPSKAFEDKKKRADKDFCRDKKE